jgi:hypothetical protein
MSATFVLTCYGSAYYEATHLGSAYALAESHIRQTCPHGEMPWADPIAWHETTDGSLVSAANGEYLNHMVLKESRDG